MKTRQAFLGIAALLIAAIFTLTGCPPGDTSGGAIVISGTLSSGGTPSPNIMARSSARNVHGSSQSFSGEVQSDNTIVGLLQDGAMIFKLTGVYNPENKSFSMQAASSMFVFSLSGVLDLTNAIIPEQSQAALHVKDNSGEWETIALNISPANVSVEGQANQPDAEVTPAWARGMWYDQFFGGIVVITENAISVIMEDHVEAFTILEVETVNDNVVKILLRAALIDDHPIIYTARFYVTRSSTDTNITTAFDGVSLKDVTFGMGKDELLSTALAGLPSGSKLFITPYCSNDPGKVYTDDPYIMNGDYSPMFIREGHAVSDAMDNSNVLKAISSFTMVLMNQYHGTFEPPMGELTITGLDDLQGKYAFGSIMNMGMGGGFSQIFATSDNTMYFHSRGGLILQDGTVKLNVILATGSGPMIGYSGSETLTFQLYILNTGNPSFDQTPLERGTVTVTFANGIGTGVYKPPAKLTITGLEEFNGKFVYASHESHNHDYTEYTWLDASGGIDTSNIGGSVVNIGFQIVNGSVTIPVYIYDNGSFSPFGGSGTYTFKVYVKNTANTPDIFEVGFVTATFTDGGTASGAYTSPGKLTIFGLTNYIGGYIYAQTMDPSGPNLVANAGVGVNTEYYGGRLITDASITLFVYHGDLFEVSGAYTGSDLLDFGAVIIMPGDLYVGGRVNSVNFTNGVGTGMLTPDP